VSKPQYGRKMVCTACAVRFYDLSRSPAVCPKCGVEQLRAKPRIATRVAPVSRGSAAGWPARVPPTIAAIIPDPTPAEVELLDGVEAGNDDAAEDGNDDAAEIEVADDEDDAIKVKHDD
jgi:uncharacterized protein (TIGR02300 family)